MRKLRKLRTQRGESLLEVVVSTMVVAMAVVILAGSLVAAARANRKSGLFSDTSDIGQSVLVAPRRASSDTYAEGNVAIQFIPGSSDITMDNPSSEAVIRMYSSEIKTVRREDGHGDSMGAFYYYDLSSESAP